MSTVSFISKSTYQPNLYIYIVRTGFEFLAQKIDGLKPKKPKTMNL